MFRKIVLLAMITCTQISIYAQTTPVNENLEPKDFQQKLKSTKSGVLVDVRTPEEVQQGIIKGAVNLDYRSEDFKKQLSKLDKEKTYFLYCAAGGRGSKAADMMEELGFKRVYNLDGGLTAWQEEGLPVEKK